MVDWSLRKRGMGSEVSKVVRNFEPCHGLGTHTPLLHPTANVDRSFRRSVSVTLGPPPGRSEAGPTVEEAINSTPCRPLSLTTSSPSA